MIVEIFPSSVEGSIPAPASKSMMQRAIAATFLSEKPVHIQGYSPSADVDAALALIENLGASVEKQEGNLFIQANQKSIVRKVNIGESGLGIRLFSPILALFNESYTIAAKGTLNKRPLHLIQNVLQENGVNCSTNNGFAPISIEGPLKAGTIQLDATEGSQFLSGLLMALPMLKNDSELLVENLRSKPYIDMTLGLLKSFGISIEHKEYKQFIVHGNQHYNATDYLVEGDWSGAAFLLVAAAINGSVKLDNLRKDSLQGDKNIVEVLAQAGADIDQEDSRISVKKSFLKAFVYDATETPDLFPPLAALAASCKGISRIKGVHRLIHKESNRAEAIQDVFEKLGLKIRFEEDEMLIEGGIAKGGVVSSHHDHRIAMMATVLGLTASGTIIINDAESIDKSYPQFYEDMQKLGVRIKY